MCTASAKCELSAGPRVACVNACIRTSMPYLPEGFPPRASTLALALLALALVPAASQAACSNPVACENQLAGTPESVWEVDGSGDPTIQGFATSMSVNKGDAVAFKIKSSTSNYKIDILRLGYYGGDGARMVAPNLTPTNTAAQPACQTFAATGLIDCGNWSVSRTWTVPSTAVSGVYIALLTRNDTGGQSQIPFVVRDDASHSAMVVQTSDETWQAYNTYGGNSLYQCDDGLPPGLTEGLSGGAQGLLQPPARRRGLDRAVLAVQRRRVQHDPLPRAERLRPQLHERRRHARAAATCSRTTRSSSPAATTSTGPRRSARTSPPRATPASTSRSSAATRCSGRPASRRASDGSSTANRTLVSYKDTHFDNPADRDPVTWTGTWRDLRFSSAERQHAGKRPHRDLVRGQLGHLGDHGAVRVPPAADVAQHRRDVADLRPEPDAGARDAGLRVGRRLRTTASARPASSGSPRRR